MFVQWLILGVGCIIAKAEAEGSCHNWKQHRNFHLLHSGDDCGQTKIKPFLAPRILNGISVTRGSLPWMAFILIYQGFTSTSYGCTRVLYNEVTCRMLTSITPEKYFSCGGSVINENYILTAAHCIDKNNPLIVVVLGLHNRDTFQDDSNRIYKVANYTIHPRYNNKTILNDIALLRLERSISFESPYINYVCLPTSCELARKDFLGEYLTMSGWGLMSNKQSATTLQKVRVPVKECVWYENMKKYLLPSKSNMCAGDRHALACQGDSGGPLVYQTAGRAVQVGILSQGPATCSSSADDQVDLYTKVSSYMDWILDNIEA